MKTWAQISSYDWERRTPGLGIALSFTGTLNCGVIRVEIIFLPVVETLAAIYIDTRKSLAASFEIFANNNTSVNRAIN